MRYRLLTCAAALCLTCGCHSAGETAAAVAGAAALGGVTASNSIDQVYYLGLFDPHEQVPQAIYRVRVRGQASFISSAKFASGWLPAAAVDTLNSRIAIDHEDGGKLKVETNGETAGIPTGRGLMTFGPEGFRPVPRDHRLVVVMGSSPEKFFKAAGELLSNVTSVEIALKEDEATQKITAELLRIAAERRRLEDLRRDVAVDAAKEGVGE